MAEFEPASALGRIHSGQVAELRLTGFPWLQYGTVAARVASVASEPRDGSIRVELDLLPGGPSLIAFSTACPAASMLPSSRSLPRRCCCAAWDASWIPIRRPAISRTAETMGKISPLAAVNRGSRCQISTAKAASTGLSRRGIAPYAEKCLGNSFD